MSFDWRDRLEWQDFERFDADPPVIGRSAWRALLEDVLPGPRDTEPGPWADQILSTFIARARAEQAAEITRKTARVPCLFVSHRRIDVDYAERIGYDACIAGFAYWLDVHDPQLRAVSPADPRYSILVAGIIEIGLINSTHLMVAATPAITGSSWIPYEYGRAKESTIVSTIVACWTHPGFIPSTAGEYLGLGTLAPDESAVEHWLRAAYARCPGAGRPFPLLHWLGRPTPDPLAAIVARNS